MPRYAGPCRHESVSGRHFWGFFRFPKLRVAGSNPVSRSKILERLRCYAPEPFLVSWADGSPSRWAGESAAVDRSTAQRTSLSASAFGSGRFCVRARPAIRVRWERGFLIRGRTLKASPRCSRLSFLLPLPLLCSSLVKKLSGVQGSAVAKTPLVLPLRDVMTSPNCKSAALTCRRFISTYADKFSHIRGDDLS